MHNDDSLTKEQAKALNLIIKDAKKLVNRVNKNINDFAPVKTGFSTFCTLKGYQSQLVDFHTKLVVIKENVTVLEDSGE